MILLDILNVTKRFGGLTAVDSVNLSIEKGQIFGLIGPNGSGKSTLFNCITGIYRPTSGKVMFQDREITGLKPWDIAKMHIARTFQIVKPFNTKTVLYNVMVGSFARTTSPARARQVAVEVLEKLNLADKRDVLAKNLTIADRKRLELARALATEPQLLLLDEVMAGLRPTEVEETLDVIRDLRDGGMTIFVIEHIMRAIMSISDKVLAINFGKKIAEGAPTEVANDEMVIKAYLGEDYVIT
jgi:branched-chain amino acid transport system ATP-binding protein